MDAEDDRAYSVTKGIGYRKSILFYIVFNSFNLCI